MGNAKSKSGSGSSSRSAAYTLNGLYATCEWDSKSIRTLVSSRRLAPLSVGATEETRAEQVGVLRPRSASAPLTPLRSSLLLQQGAITPANYEEECPICFLVRSAPFRARSFGWRIIRRRRRASRASRASHAAAGNVVLQRWHEPNNVLSQADLYRVVRLCRVLCRRARRVSLSPSRATHTASCKSSRRL